MNGVLTQISKKLIHIDISEEKLKEDLAIKIQALAKEMSIKLALETEIPEKEDFGEYLVGIAEQTSQKEALQYFPLIAEKALQDYDLLLDQVNISWGAKNSENHVLDKLQL